MAAGRPRRPRRENEAAPDRFRPRHRRRHPNVHSVYHRHHEAFSCGHGHLPDFFSAHLRALDICRIFFRRDLLPSSRHASRVGLRKSSLHEPFIRKLGYPIRFTKQSRDGRMRNITGPSLHLHLESYAGGIYQFLIQDASITA